MFTSPGSNIRSGSNSQVPNTTVQLPTSLTTATSYHVGTVSITPLNSIQDSNIVVSRHNIPECNRLDMEQFKKEKQEILKAIEEDNLQKLLQIRPDITKEYRLVFFTIPSEHFEVTILFYSATYKKNKIVEYFMRDTSTLLSEKQTNILEIIKNRENEKFFSLSKYTDFYFFDKDLHSPLYHAINTNNIEITKSLMTKAPALLNLYIHGAPPLMYAMSKGYVELTLAIYVYKKSVLLKRDHRGNLGAFQYALTSRSSKMVDCVVQLLEESTQQECSKYTKIQMIQLLEEGIIKADSVYTKLQFEADLLKAQEMLNVDIRNSEKHFARMKKALRIQPELQMIQGNQSNQKQITILTSSTELLHQNSSHSETPQASITPKTPLSPFSTNSHYLKNSSSSMRGSRELGLSRSSEEIDNPILPVPTNSPDQRPINSPSSSLENLSLQSEVERLQKELKQAHERIQLLEQNTLKSIDESSKSPIMFQFNNNAASTSHAKDPLAQPSPSHQTVINSYKDRKKSTSLIGGLEGIYKNIKGALSPSNINK